MLKFYVRIFLSDFLYDLFSDIFFIFSSIAFFSSVTPWSVVISSVTRSTHLIVDYAVKGK